MLALGRENRRSRYSKFRGLLPARRPAGSCPAVSLTFIDELSNLADERAGLQARPERPFMGRKPKLGTNGSACCRTSVPPKLPRDCAREYGWFKALADPTRIRILNLLAANRGPVCDIVKHFPIGQPTISHHLKILRDTWSTPNAAARSCITESTGIASVSFPTQRGGSWAFNRARDLEM
jgi:DNA-binding transcriptional ArsR family regulator